MEYDDPLQEEYRNELEACYRGWLHGWIQPFTASFFGIDLNFCFLVYAALNRRWPGMGARELHDPAAWRPSYVPDLTNDRE